MEKTELFPHDAFHSELRSCNQLETEYTDYVKLLKKKIDHRTSCYQTEFVQGTPYWNWQLSLLARNMEARTNELIQGLSAVV